MQALFRELGERVREAREEGGQVAYIFCGANIAELFRSFGFMVLHGEILALQPAAKKASLPFITVAENVGFSSPDVCGYHQIEIGRILAGEAHAYLGPLPPPSLVMVHNNCVAVIKWAEFISRYYGVPMVTIDVPYLPSAGYLYDPEDEEYKAQRRYVLSQIWDAIKVCEAVTGRKLDVDRLREHEAYSNQMADIWTEIININKERPAAFDCMLDGLNYLGIWNAYRGTREGVEYLALVREELRERRELGITPLPQERFRLLLDGVPCYPYLRQWMALFHKWGAVTVWAHYLNLSGGGMEKGFRHDTSHPVESLADYLLAMNIGRGGITHQLGYHEWPKLVAEYKADGIVFHAAKSCRITSTWMPDLRERLTQQGIPSLVIDADIVDPRFFFEAQMRNRVDAFLEALTSAKVRG